MKSRIPSNIITGFLGVGKTTAITHLLRHKPEGEKWSVLVNEFGEIGIDGALLKETNAQVREVPGGCICCVAGLPMKMALNMMIARTNPDRIIVEPTGLGHPEEIISTLTGEYYNEVLDLRATITLVDPRKLADERYTGNANFQDQIAVADVLVANKMDVCGPEDKQRFDQLVAAFTPAKQGAYKVTQGALDPAWLDLPRQSHQLQHPQHHQAQKLGARGANPLSPQRDAYNPKVSLPAGERFVRRENRSGEARSCGWLFAPELVFHFNGLFGLLSGLDCWRAKAVMNTTEGVYMFNAENGVLSVNPMAVAPADILDSRLELIDDKPLDAAAIETQLLGLCTNLDCHE
jgi:G3E family GTPase